MKDHRNVGTITEIGLRRSMKTALPKRGGPWDIVASCDDRVVFIECKGAGDRIRDSQVFWLDKALSAGFEPGQFAIVNFVVVRQ